MLKTRHLIYYKRDKKGTMTTYQHGKIYSIRSRSRPDLVYIGSTTQALSKRFGKHKAPSNLTRSREIIAIGDAYIELIQDYPCENKEQLNRRAGQVQRSMDCVNIRIEGRTKSQWYADNAEAMVIKHTHYKQHNKDSISAQTKQYLQKNKDTISAKTKQYHLAKKEMRICICGVSYNYGITSKRNGHYSSQKHQNHVQLILEVWHAV